MPMNEKHLMEVKKLRRENAKVFRGENGVYKMEVYPNKVHYFDPVTNVFEENNSKYKRTEHGYTTTDGVREREFFTDADKPETVEFRSGDAGFSMRFLGISSGKKMIREARCGKVSLHDAKPIAACEGMLSEDVRPSVKYEDVLELVDVEYVNLDRQLKENIIIKGRLESYVFDFAFETEHLILKTDNAHRILAFYDRRHRNSDPLYLLPAPYMTDAAGERSDAVYYQVKRKSAGEYKLAVVANADWINSEDRLFPVTVDPTIIELEPAVSMSSTVVTTSSAGTVDSSGMVGYDKYGNTYSTTVSPILPPIDEAVCILGGSIDLYVGPGAGPAPTIAVNGSGFGISDQGTAFSCYLGMEEMNAVYAGGGAPAISISPIAKGQKPDSGSGTETCCPCPEDCCSGDTCLDDCCPEDPCLDDCCPEDPCLDDCCPEDPCPDDCCPEDPCPNDCCPGDTGTDNGATDNDYIHSPPGSNDNCCDDCCPDNSGNYDSGEDSTIHSPPVSNDDCCDDCCLSGTFSLRSINETVTDHTILVGEGKSFTDQEVMTMSLTSTYNESTSVTDAAAEENDENYDSYVIVGGAATTVQQGLIVVYFTEYYDYADNPPIMYPERGTYNNDFINLHTGHLTLKHDDLTVDGATIPVSLSHYYASLYRDETAQSAANIYNCGDGWKLSAQQKIEQAADDGTTEYIYTDASGKRHYFVQTNDGSIVDTGGLHLTYSGSFGSECYITDRGGNKMTFDYKGNLCKVSDRNGNTLTYTYENGKLVKATDSFGRETVLIYENDLLSEIRDPQSRCVKFFYSGTDLIRIEEPDGKCTTYAYDDRHHITEVGNPDGVKIVYTYEENTDRIVRTDKYAALQSTVHGCVTEAETPEAGEYNIFEYRGKRSTAVTDRSGIRHVYIFDDTGRVEVEYEDSITDGTQEKGQVTAVSVSGYSDKKRVFRASLAAADPETENLLSNSAFDTAPTTYVSSDNFIKIGGSSSDGVTSDSCIKLTKSYKFASVSTEKYLKQTVDITNDPSATSGHRILPGDSLLFSAWAKAATTQIEADNTKFELRALMHYTDNTEETVTAAYDTEYAGWQYTAVPLRPAKDKTLEYVSLYMDCSYMSVDVCFNSPRLVHAISDSVNIEENLSEYITVFDESVQVVQRITEYDGITTTVTENTALSLPVSTTATDLNGNSYVSVDHYDKLFLPVRTTVTDLAGNSFVSVNKYDAKGNCIAAQNYRGNVVLTDYTEKGQVLKTRAYHSASFNTSAALNCPADRFVKEYKYDKNSEYLKSETDARSAEICTQYDYDEDSGLLNYVTDAGGVRTTYAYDHATKAMTMASTSVDGQNNSVAYGYTNRLLTAITHNGFEYRFDYDGFGRQTKITAGGHLLASNTYTLTDTTTVTTTYATGEQIEVVTDRHQSPIRKTYTNDSGTVTVVENEYDELGKVTRSVDNVADIVYTYTYDRRGNVIEEYRNGTQFKAIEYDENNRLTKTTVTTSDETLVYTPVYETNSDGAIYPDNALKGMVLEGIFEESITKDVHQRPGDHSLKVGTSELLGTSYSYLTVDNRLTSLVDSIGLRVNGNVENTLRYEYDNNGNITAVYQQGSLLAQYKYDGLNRLVRENNFALGKTYTFAYDAAGNILCKRTYAVTSGAVVTPLESKDYVYDSAGWKDRLVSYDGTAITYDSLGNPTSYRGHNLVWDRVRLLKQWDDILFSYDANGIRTRKGNTTYELDGSNIVSETTNGNTIRYYYGNGELIGFRYNGQRYYYEKNLQGDIVGVYNTAGSLVGAYLYDAWGNCTVTTDGDGIATINPFRYRGYYFDSDTGQYYLKTRYYDPATGRFINADEVNLLGTNSDFASNNLFAYCGNNPVIRVDSTGCFWQEFWDTFVRTLQKCSGYFSISAGVAVLDSPALGPADALSGLLMLGGLLFCGLVAVGLTAANSNGEIKLKRNNSVYVLRDDTGTVQYVGRTNNVAKRAAAHNANPFRAGLEMEIIASGLTYAESRALEQAGMAYYHTINTASKMSNQINGVAPKYWNAYKELALGALNYGWNQMSNEILYWINN